MDTMDSKHHQAFCPQLIRVYGLEEYAGLITPHWMEVNLYSRTRGVNRFKGLAATMRMLAEHGVRVPRRGRAVRLGGKGPLSFQTRRWRKPLRPAAARACKNGVGMEPRRQRGHRRHGR